MQIGFKYHFSLKGRITFLKHKNILGVAAAKDLAAIIICEGIIPDAELIQTAAGKNIPLYSSKESAFYVSGKLYVLLEKNGI